MYVYSYRIFDRHQQPVMSLAILAEPDPAAPQLKRQLTRRFQQLPAWVEERLGQASREELESWADRVLDAESIDEVFAPG